MIDSSDGIELNNNMPLPEPMITHLTINAYIISPKFYTHFALLCLAEVRYIPR